MNKPLDDSALKRPMKKLMAKQGVGWIKLQDRKPEDGQLCLVWIRAFPASDARGDIAYWNNGHGFESDHWFPEDVICWQPFPNPPTDVES